MENKYDKDYINLELPSGNLWKIRAEEDYYTYDEAVDKFGDNLPTKEDFKELYDNCTWVLDEENKGLLFTSKINGEKIFFKANGYHNGSDAYFVGDLGYYWTSTPIDASSSYCLYFSGCYVERDCIDICNNSYAVQLVQKPNTTINKPTNKNAMTTKEMIAVMTAFEEGKEIERKAKYKSEWEYCYAPAWDWEFWEYRIKPEEVKPKYRPYQNAEELDEAIKEKGTIIKSKNSVIRYNILEWGNDYAYISHNSIMSTFNSLLENFIWADGTPFGILEE